MPATSDITIGDCIANGYDVTIWCAGHPCPGRPLDVRKMGRWADRGLIELADAGRFKCSACGSPARFISVTEHLVNEPVLRWTAGPQQAQR